MLPPRWESGNAALPMFIPYLQRHIAVCALADLPGYAKRDPGFWNVISVLGPEAPSPSMSGFRAHHRAHLDDIRAPEQSRVGANGMTAGIAFMRGILNFVDARPGEAVLIHCLAGVSRSPAVALILILRALREVGTSDPVSEAVNTLLAVRPQARPNPLVLGMGLRCFLSKDEAECLNAGVMAGWNASVNLFSTPSEPNQQRP